MTKYNGLAVSDVLSNVHTHIHDYQRRKSDLSSAYGMTVCSERSAIEPLSLNARPLRALLATRIWTARVRAPLKRLAALDSSPHSTATVLIAHLRKRTPEHM